MNTLQAIAEVQADLAKIGIDKTSRNEFHKFNFRGIDAVQQTLSPLLAKHGLVIMPTVLERIVTEQQTQKGGSQTNVAVRVEYVFRCDEETDSTSRTALACQVWGEATDTGDKATSKALSMAYKYMVFQVFCPPLSGADDADEGSPEPAARSGQAPKEIPGRFESADEAMTCLAECRSRYRIQFWGEAVKASGFRSDELDRLRTAASEAQKGMS
jgi:hypothetical protein